MNIRPVIHYPFGPPGERVEYVQPPLVACRDELDEGAEDCQRFAVRPALLRLSHAITKCFDGFLISDFRGTREVRSCFTKPTSSE